jgi:hypothetical protein
MTIDNVKKIDELFYLHMQQKTGIAGVALAMAACQWSKRKAGISTGSRLSGAQLKHLTDVLGIFFECFGHLTDFGIHLTVV